MKIKVGDLVKPKRRIIRSGVMAPKQSYKVFLVMRVEPHPICVQVIWLYPDPDGTTGCDHTDDDNYYFGDYFEVVNESR